MNACKTSALVLLALGATVFSSPGQAADILSTLNSALTNSANQTVYNTQSGAQSAIQNTIQSSLRNSTPVQAQGAVASGQAIAANPTLNPKTLCSQIPAALQSKYTHVCASFNPNDPCSMLPIDGTWLKSQANLVAMCNARQSAANLQNQATAQVTTQPANQANQIIQSQINQQATSAESKLESAIRGGK